jgi:metallo-beta-lactamase family protein
MKFVSCGAAQFVTGSCHKIILDSGFTFLLDCGLFQGKGKDIWDWNNEWLFDPEEIDTVILSHAHIDHCGRLPKLVKDGFKGSIYSTHATRSLCNIMLMDSAMIQERDVEYFNQKERKKDKSRHREKRKALYTTKDVTPALERFIGCPYNHWIRINDELEVLYTDAGHILGSACVTLRIQENGQTIMFGFTADIGRKERPILRDPQPMPEVDFLICESTYGDRAHEEAPAEVEHFLNIVKHTCIEKKGKLIIPAFSVGRTQEIVYLLDQLEHEGRLPRIPVFVDSPLSVNATHIYASHPECYDKDLVEYLLVDDNPFGFNSLEYIREASRSKTLKGDERPMIIISSAGMMNAGRVKHHLYNNIEDPKNTILIVGYCTPETPGGLLRDGADEISLFGDRKKVRAEIEIMDSFSAHGDKNEMVDFISNQKERCKKVFLVHGEYEVQKSFRGYLLSEGFRDVIIPAKGEAFTLEI